MTHATPSAPLPAHALTALPHDRTDIELIWIEGRLEHWIRFGRVAQERILSRRSRTLSFLPDSMIAFVRWASSDYGTVHSRIDILRTVRIGETFSTAPFVRPGGDLCLSMEGWPKVAKVLAAIDAVEATGVDPCDAAPDHWRHVANRISAGESPRSYTVERHEAWRKRKALGL
ncbi:DUF2840 domain-containing protein [Sphingobium sp. BS19]|uniref:DUF2840 domain-containing protein n=1 Tax=Sphingobium sp. BS19 TaxID=3018973 RepID=UPI0022EF8D10|nr:DUF2840 domain-containing protein [Sphingobium sp. BS19]GLI98011.1 hypothetical protein Sbs19_18290 [Sphingobium sp. BS19]